jgi:hypothetical protein
VRLRTLIEDYDQHQQVAVSLADDLIQLGPQAITQPLLGPGDAETVAAAEEFEPLLRKYIPAYFEWTKLSRAAHAEAREKFGDDYSSDGWSKPLAGTSPGTAFLYEAHKRNGCDQASRATGVLREEMEPLAEAIRDADITTIVGLRAKTLVAIWDALPMYSGHDGVFDLDDERIHWSLFSGAIAVTGFPTWWTPSRMNCRSTPALPRARHRILSTQSKPAGSRPAGFPSSIARQLAASPMLDCLSASPRWVRTCSLS